MGRYSNWMDDHPRIHKKIVAKMHNIIISTKFVFFHNAVDVMKKLDVIIFSLQNDIKFSDFNITVLIGKNVAIRAF